MKITASRPHLPKEYGATFDDEGCLPWSFVTERMREALHFWLTTVTPEQAPHPRPIDGLWVDDALYFGGSPDSKWVANLHQNALATLNLEDPEQAVILHGTVDFVRPGSELARRLAEESNRKYQQHQLPTDYDGVVIAQFQPNVVFGWHVLFEDATKWELLAE